MRFEKEETALTRCLSNFDASVMGRASFDAVIVGGGLAGIFCALNLPRRMKTAVLCKGSVEDCDSYLAQGGIAASIGSDDRGLHIRDTMTAGCGVNNPQAVRILVEESEQAIRKLAELGVSFDRRPDGRFQRSLEGNHSARRILHVNGDATGKGIMTALIARCAGRDNISLLENTFAVDLVTREGTCSGVIAEKAGRLLCLSSPAVVMATGGIGQLFPVTTNSKVLTGDGIAAASRAGAALDSLEFIQFHPTALYSPVKAERAFLISEAVRGEGALLRNREGDRFMPRYDARLELAPRDIVARAIFDQMAKTSSPCVYLDITGKKRAFLERRFPMIFSECLKRGIDISKDWIPVVPCEHYCMGGIRTDCDGRTSVDRLYAIGECACTGVHGANRLASNSLLEDVVFGARAAAAVAGRAAPPADVRDFRLEGRKAGGLADPEKLRAGLRLLMEEDAGIIRSGRKLGQALAAIEKVQRERIDPADLTTREEYETADMVETARLIVSAAVKNRSSIGCHYIVDS
ncbi:L-aspartate oxidase [Caproicibacter fermentans]|uniref:L-aspartate oxidase n=1 Tax=Caproicibacter fermentans TaxID=2576756 RepID=UPI001F35D353|nr:L-aspartate oxidase [Caproicibacter fermentans]